MSSNTTDPTAIIQRPCWGISLKQFLEDFEIYFKRTYPNLFLNVVSHSRHRLLLESFHIITEDLLQSQDTKTHLLNTSAYFKSEQAQWALGLSYHERLTFRSRRATLIREDELTRSDLRHVYESRTQYLQQIPQDQRLSTLLAAEQQAREDERNRRRIENEERRAGRAERLSWNVVSQAEEYERRAGRDLRRPEEDQRRAERSEKRASRKALEEARQQRLQQALQQSIEHSAQPTHPPFQQSIHQPSEHHPQPPLRPSSRTGFESAAESQIYQLAAGQTLQTLLESTTRSLTGLSIAANAPVESRIALGRTARGSATHGSRIPQESQQYSDTAVLAPRPIGGSKPSHFLFRERTAKGR